jgi:hypothetical protein
VNENVLIRDCVKGEKPHQATRGQTRPHHQPTGKTFLAGADFRGGKGFDFVTEAFVLRGARTVCRELHVSASTSTNKLPVRQAADISATSAAELIQEETRRYYFRHMDFRCLQF